MSALHVALLLSLLSSQDPPPDVIIGLPSAASSLPQIEKPMRWLSTALPEFAPDRARNRVREALGVDLMSVEGLTKMGIKTDAEIVLRLMPDPGVLLMSLPIADQSLVRAATDNAMKLRDDAQPLGGGTGFVAGSTPQTVVLMHRTPTTLWIAIGDGARRSLTTRTSTKGARTAPPWKKDRRLAPLEKAMRKTIPRPMKGLATGAAAWIVVPHKEQRIDLALFTDERGFELRGDTMLDVAKEIALLETMRPLHSRPLLGDVRELPITAEGSAALTKAGVMRVLQRIDAPLTAARHFTGDVHVVLSGNGALVLAATLDGKTDTPEVQKVIEAIKKNGNADVLTDPEPMLIVWRGKTDRAAIQAAARAVKKDQRAAVSLSVDPKSLVRALEGRTDAGDGLAPRPMDLVFARLTLSPLLDATREARVELSSPKPPHVRLRARIDLR